MAISSFKLLQEIGLKVYDTKSPKFAISWVPVNETVGRLSLERMRKKNEDL